MGKMITTVSKKYLLSIVVPQVDGGVFPSFVVEHHRI